MKFDSTEVTSEKKSFSDLTKEHFPFWEIIFKKMKISDPMFRTKLCYNSKEFSNMEKFLAVSFFESELENKTDIYVEFCDWNSNFFEPMFRKLYKYKYDPNWRKFDKLAPAKRSSKSYAIKVSDLELINTTSLTASEPENIDNIVKDKIETIKEETPIPTEIVDMDMEDAHHSAMSMRDLYCMIHNIPLSNTLWLNEFIKKGREWQRKQK